MEEGEKVLKLFIVLCSLVALSSAFVLVALVYGPSQIYGPESGPDQGIYGSGSSEVFLSPAELIAHYKFDSVGAGGRVEDSSGRGNHGKAFSITTPAGVLDNSYNFNGSSYVNTQSDLDLLGDFAINLWVKMDKKTSETGQPVQILITKTLVNHNWASYSLRVMGDDKLEFAMHPHNDATKISVASKGALQTDKWYMMTASLSSGNMTLYLNGVKDNTQSAQGLHAYNNNETVFIGATNVSSAPPQNFFNGQIDEVKIYRGSLTDAQISSAYNQITKGELLVFGFDNINIQQGTVADTSFKKHQGTITGIPAKSMGIVNDAIYLDGNSYVTTESINLGKEFTLSAWVRVENTTTEVGDQSIIDKVYIGRNWAPYSLRVSDGNKPEFVFHPHNNATNIVVQSPKGIERNRWHLITATLKDSQLRIYLDGNLERTVNTQGLSPYSNDDPVFIGAANGVASVQRRLKGSIDEAKILDYAMGAEDIKGAYQQSMQLYYRFDSTRGDRVTDESFNKFNGQIFGDLDLVDGVEDDGAKFDGSSYIEVPSEMNMDSEFTISTWIKPERLTSELNYTTQRLIDKGVINESYASYNLAIDENNKIISRVYTANRGDALHEVSSNTTLRKDEWYHIVALFSPSLGGSTLSIYINGEQDGTTAFVNSSAFNSDTRLTIGAIKELNPVTGTYSYARYFHGVMDETMIFNRALRESEIEDLFDEFKEDEPDTEPEPDPDPSSGNETNESGSTSSSGTSSSGSTWPSQGSSESREDPETDSSTGKIMFYILITIIILALAGAIVAFVFHMAKMKKNPPRTSPGVTYGQQRSQYQQGQGYGYRR